MSVFTKVPASDERTSAPASRRRRVLFVLGAVGGLVLLLWVGGYAAAGERVPKGTTVLGVSIGGLSPAAAEAKLRRDLADPLTADLPMRVGKDTYALDPAKAGLEVDVAATVDAIAGRTWNPIQLIGRLVGGGEVEPVVTVDEAKLSAAIERLAKRVDRDPVDGTVRFSGATVVSTEAAPGRVLSRKRAAALVREHYLDDEGALALPAKKIAPKVSQAEVDRAVKEFADPAMSGPVTVAVAGERISLPPDVIGPALSMTADSEGRLQPELNGAKLRKLAAKKLKAVESEGANATFRISNGRPRVVPARQGRAIDPDELATAVLPVLAKTGDERVATVALSVREPEITTKKARSLGVKELMSTFTTYYPSNFAPRLTNIHRAADYMDNTLVLPGDTFSLNKEVGERTAARGFAAGYIIRNGKLAVDLGGGVSQLATTTFNAAFFAGLEDVEHHPHSFYISRYPEGREATVAWGAKDLRFRNDSGNAIFVTTSYTNSSITVSIYGTKIYRIRATKSGRYQIKPFQTVNDPRPGGTRPGDCVHQEGVVGFKVDVSRLFYQGNSLVRTERFHTVYQPEDRVICGSKPSKPVVADPPD